MNTKTFKLFTLPLLLSFAFSLLAQEPSGYYKSAEGKNKAALLDALCKIVGPHTNVGYDGLWEVYKESDVRPGTSYFWDMYSTANYPINGSKNCSNGYKKVGDCVNREHSIPQSWFKEAQPMKSDAFHIYPTDGKVNGQRSNYPYGECANGTTLSNNGLKGLGKLGKSTFPGYSGTVFEPDDEYKGDFARSYFYMAACYNNKIAGWNSDMLAKNKYPCYTTWAVNLLMKWHEQDPVSQKEIDRNNAVYKYQRNRNPFIDHPELADYVWGDKKDEGWIPGGIQDPIIISPVNGKSIDLGITAINKDLTAQITIKAQGLTKDLNISVAGEGFSTSATTISKDIANGNGTTITVTYRSAKAATSTGTLKISSSEVSSTATLKAQAVDGIPALPAENIDMYSFTARWSDLDKDGSKYNLTVSDANHTPLQGYPVEVDAKAERYNVDGLEYASTYYYSLEGNGKESNEITVRTSDPDRTISCNIPDGKLVLTATPGTASEPVAVDIETEYIEDDITVTVSGVFEISSDKTDWKKSLTIDRSGERIYIRIPAVEEGSYSGTLSASTPTVSGFDADIIGMVTAPRTFIEDFESGTTTGYDSKDYTGSACEWTLSNAGVYGANGQDKFRDSKCMRFGKNASSSIAMAEDKLNGAGTLAFYAAPFNKDEKAEVDILYSIDQGNSWTKISTVTIDNTVLKEFTVNVKIAQPVRFKFQQTSGKRICIDDISISDYTQSGIESAHVESWDAYSSNGEIIIESSANAEIAVYAMDAIKVYSTTVGNGTVSVKLPKGVYIVVNGDDNRKVIVR